jgi:hypothetical protein
MSCVHVYEEHLKLKGWEHNERQTILLQRQAGFFYKAFVKGFEGGKESTFV